MTTHYIFRVLKMIHIICNMDAHSLPVMYTAKNGLIYDEYVMQYLISIYVIYGR